MSEMLFNKHKIHWIEKGEGSPLVLLHGFCEDASMWNDIIPVISGHHIIAIDLPGFGQSEPFDFISIDGMAEIVKQVVVHSGISRFKLMGHSMGGYISAAYARKYPEDLISIGLIHSHPFDDTEVGKEGRNKGLAFIKKYGHQAFVEKLVPRLFPQDFIKNHSAVVNDLIRKASEGPEQGVSASLIAMRDRSDNSSAIKDLECPVLFIIGENDVIIPISSGLQQTTLPKIAKVHIMRNVGHMGMFEDPDQMTAIINQFLKFSDDENKKHLDV